MKRATLRMLAIVAAAGAGLFFLFRRGSRTSAGAVAPVPPPASVAPNPVPFFNPATIFGVPPLTAPPPSFGGAPSAVPQAVAPAPAPAKPPQSRLDSILGTITGVAGAVSATVGAVNQVRTSIGSLSPSMGGSPAIMMRR